MKIDEYIQTHSSVVQLMRMVQSSKSNLDCDDGQRGIRRGVGRCGGEGGKIEATG